MVSPSAVSHDAVNWFQQRKICVNGLTEPRTGGRRLVVSMRAGKVSGDWQKTPTPKEASKHKLTAALALRFDVRYEAPDFVC